MFACPPCIPFCLDSLTGAEQAQPKVVDGRPESAGLLVVAGFIGHDGAETGVVVG